MDSLQRILFIVVLAFSLQSPSYVHAFSFGDIRVNSSFGEKFDAEIELRLDEEGPVDVSLGGESEYQMLELHRQSILDKLKVEYPLKGKGATRTIRLVSDKPLFFPSFNLIVRATKGDGTILKNFLITVDFQQNLALNLSQGKKKKSSPSSEPARRALGKRSVKMDPGSKLGSEETVAAEKAYEEPAIVRAPSSAAIAPSQPAVNRASPMLPSGSIWVVPRTARTRVPVSPNITESVQIAKATPEPSVKQEEKPIAPAPVADREEKKVAANEVPDSPKEDVRVDPEPETPPDESPSTPKPTPVSPAVRMDKGERLYSESRLQKVRSLDSAGYRVRSPMQLDEMVPETATVPEPAPQTDSPPVAAPEPEPAPKMEAETAPVVEEMAQVAEKPPAPSPPAAQSAGPAAPSADSSSAGIMVGNSPQVRRGQTLLQTARALSLRSYSATRIAVALWLENREKFIFGNMNGIRVGTQFNLDKVLKRLETLDSKIAGAILRSQWKEWKTIRNNRLSPLPPEEPAEAIEEARLPSRKSLDKTKVFELLQGWKNSWEKGDLDAHLGHFSRSSDQDDSRGAQDLKFLKKRIFDRYKGVRLDIHRANLILNGGRVWVSFYQGFSSETMDSFGRKDIEVAREGSEWKIVNERFKLRDYREKENSYQGETREGSAFHSERVTNSPYVIHVSSHVTVAEALRVVHRLREQGYNSYLSDMKISKTRKIYRVYVGRFTDWNLTREFAFTLRNLKIGENAIPTQHPYAILAGEYGSESEANERVDALRIQGLSPFLFSASEDGFSVPVFKVYLGAFMKKKDASAIAKQLQELSIAHSIVFP